MKTAILGNRKIYKKSARKSHVFSSSLIFSINENLRLSASFRLENRNLSHQFRKFETSKNIKFWEFSLRYNWQVHRFFFGCNGLTSG